jgi:hypothetical protein
MEKSKSDIRREEFRKHVEAHEKSGLTQKEFCEKNGIVLSQFVYYRCLFRKNHLPAIKASGFNPVTVIEKEKITSGDIRISLPNGFSCQIPRDFSAEKVKQLMQVLLTC